MPASSRIRRRTLPSGGEIGYFTAADGQQLRYGLWRPASPSRGSVLVLGGRAEFIEKHDETYADLIDRGFGVAAMDWRGQGLSGRATLDPMKDHAVDFNPRRADLRAFIAGVMQKALPGPYFAIAHSMGGHLLLRHAHDHPDDFSAIAALSPMVRINLAPLPGWLIDGMITVARRFGRLDAYAPGHGPQSRRETGSTARQFLTSDVDRAEDEFVAIANNPGLALGGVSYGWLAAARASNAVLRSPGYAQAITTPALILQAGDDRVVDNAAMTRFARDLPRGKLVVIKGARHELLKENDQIRQQLWHEIMGFFKAPPV